MGKRKAWLTEKSLRAKRQKLPENGGHFASNSAVEKFYEKQVWLHLSKVTELRRNSNGEK